MKLITAIVNKQDVGEVCYALSKDGYIFTRMATTGGFLKSGNVTLLIGTEDEKVEDVIEHIRKNCSLRKQLVPSPRTDAGVYGFNAYPVEVVVGGATVFVQNVERFEKM